MSRARSLAALAVLGAAACGTDVDPVEGHAPLVDTTFTARLVGELHELSGVLTPRLLFYVLFVLGAIYVLRRAMLFSTRVVWRLGWDPARRLARLRSMLEITLLAVGGLLLLRPFFLLAPLLSGFTLAVLMLLTALALPSWVQDLVAGVALAARTRFREGDQVRFATVAGSVRHVGLWRTSIRAGDGGTISLPNREVIAHSIQVGREQRAAPIEVVIPVDLAATPAGRDAVLARAQLSAFRRAGSRASLRQEDNSWVVSMQTWCTRDLEGARRALERQLCRNGEEQP